MVDRIKSSWTRRTWKREVAVLLLLLWGVCTAFLIIVAPIDRMNAAGGLYTTMSMVVFTFALGAFGFDAWAKQAPGPFLPPAGTPR